MTAKPPHPTPAYLWFDTEFTSLEPGKAYLLQVALLITDNKLVRLTPPGADLNLTISLPAGAAVSDWVEENLAELLVECRSDKALPLPEVDRLLAARVDQAIGPPAKTITDRPVLAGNAIHMDLIMVRQFLPEFGKRLHYRLLDVSTLKILWNDRHPGAPFDKEAPGVVTGNLPAGVAPPAGVAHDAYYDIHASLAEMNFYRARLLA